MARPMILWRRPHHCSAEAALQPAPARHARGFVDDPAAADWLGHLQQLGLQPRLIVVDGGISVHPDHA